MQSRNNEVIKHLETYGISIVGLCSGVLHTIGMAHHGLPELILSTRDQKMGHWLLNRTFLELIDNGFREGINNNIIELSNGEAAPILIKKTPLSDTMKEHYIYQAVAFYKLNPEYMKTGEIQLAQVIWPDKNNKFPTDNGYNQERYEQHIFTAFQ